MNREAGIRELSDAEINEVAGGSATGDVCRAGYTAIGGAALVEFGPLGVIAGSMAGAYVGNVLCQP